MLSLANSVILPVAVLSFFVIPVPTNWFLYLFVSAAILNGLLLYFKRHARMNEQLDNDSRNRWDYAFFFASPVSYPLYTLRFVAVRPKVDEPAS